jgi:hypothetical protein
MPKERRVHLRKPLQELAYLSLPSNNGGVLTDISEGGLGFHAIGPVEAVGPLHIRFAIDSAERVAAVGELAWSDASGEIGGLRFTLLPDGVREKIRAWAERSELRPAVNAGDGAISQSASFAAAASIGRNNFAAAVDVLVAEPPAEASPSVGLRHDPLPATETAVVHAASTSAAAFAEWKIDSPPIHKTVITESESMPRTVPVQANAELLPTQGFGISEPACKQEIRADDKREAASLHEAASPNDTVIAKPHLEVRPAATRKADLEPTVVVRPPHLYSLRRPVYSAPFNALSLFPQERKPEAALRTVVVAAPHSVARTHPLAAVVLTIILSFVVSMGIFIYVSTSLAGQLLFRWEEKIWSGFYSRSLPQSLKPPGSLVPDDANTPNR